MTEEVKETKPKRTRRAKAKETPTVSKNLSVSGDFYATSTTITATVSPNGADQSNEWTVEPAEGVVTIVDNEDGTCTVTSVAAGSATVTVTSTDGGFTADCVVTVT